MGNDFEKVLHAGAHQKKFRGGSKEEKSRRKTGHGDEKITGTAYERSPGTLFGVEKKRRVA